MPKIGQYTEPTITNLSVYDPESRGVSAFVVVKAVGVPQRLRDAAAIMQRIAPRKQREGTMRILKAEFQDDTFVAQILYGNRKSVDASAVADKLEHALRDCGIHGVEAEPTEFVPIHCFSTNTVPEGPRPQKPHRRRKGSYITTR